ncbi:MAG: hypothetical protein WCI02_02075 [Planctomycetota bacterium]
MRSIRSSAMAIKIMLSAALLMSTGLTGCSICPSPYDMDYSAFGSVTPRTDMRVGRVGSIFSDPAIVGYPSRASLSHTSGLHGDGEILLEEIADENTLSIGPQTGEFYSDEPVIVEGVVVDGIEIGNISPE